MEKIKFKRTKKELEKRHIYMHRLANSKNCKIDWKNEKLYYSLYVEDKDTGVRDEEIVLARGIPATERIHSFYDIIEKKLEMH